MAGAESVNPRDRFGISPAGEWVVGRDFDLGIEQVLDLPVSALLIDRQFRTASAERYSRTAQRLNNAEGVQQLSQVDIPFDPKIETLTVHSIRIWRDGVAHERLVPERFQLCLLYTSPSPRD